MPHKLLIWTVLIFTFFCFSCSSASDNKVDSANAEEVIIDDRHRADSSNEIFIEDNDFEIGGGVAVATNAGGQNPAQIAPDGSRITTMYDGYGNKVETRYFDYHPRLKQILVRTFADGKKQAYVYGQNGEVKGLPDNLSNKFLTSSADEIANAVGISNTITQTSTFVQNAKPLNATPLQPMPSYKFPVQNQPVQQTASEEIENSKPPLPENIPNAKVEEKPQQKENQLP